MKNTSKDFYRKLTLGGLLTALVILLQVMGSFIRFGPFSVSLVLIPIVIGAATCGSYIGAWLGFVFGLAVLLSGDATAFLVISVPGTILTVLAKGILCGLLAGVTYRLLAKWNTYVGVFAAAIVCPLVNTGVFLIGCRLFFWDTLITWAADTPFGNNMMAYLFGGVVGFNFLFELGANILLSPIVVKLLTISRKIK